MNAFSLARMEDILSQVSNMGKNVTVVLFWATALCLWTAPGVT
jgi:hypothetical protein